MKIIDFFRMTNICCHCVWFPPRAQDLSTKLWTHLLTDLKLPSTAWQAATSHHMTSPGSRDLEHTILKRSLSSIAYAKAHNLSILLIWNNIFFYIPRWPFQNPKLPVSRLEYVTHSTSLPLLWILLNLTNDQRAELLLVYEKIFTISFFDYVTNITHNIS